MRVSRADIFHSLFRLSRLKSPECGHFSVFEIDGSLAKVQVSVGF